MPERMAEDATSAATSPASTATKTGRGQTRLAPPASRNRAAARTCSVRASGQSVKMSAVSAP